VHRDIFLQYKPTRCTISQIYFGIELYMFRIGLLSIIRSLNTVHTAIGICHTSYDDCLLAVSINCMTYSYCCVYSTRLLMTERNPLRNM